MLDLRGVSFIGSSGVNLLVEELPRAMFSGARVVVESTPVLDRVLRLVRFGDPFAAWSLAPVASAGAAAAEAA